MQSSCLKFTVQLSHIKFTVQLSHIKFTVQLSHIKFTVQLSHLKFTVQLSHSKFTAQLSRFIQCDPQSARDCTPIAQMCPQLDSYSKFIQSIQKLITFYKKCYNIM